MTKPYGRRNPLRHNLENTINEKDNCNWWEVEFSNVEKKRARREAKEEIRKELEVCYD